MDDGDACQTKNAGTCTAEGDFISRDLMSRVSCALLIERVCLVMYAGGPETEI